ncbi:MAG: penicillin acylase family protein, partial [Burkholderiaceae bacterium]
PLTEPVKTLLRDFKGSMAMNQPQPLILAAWLDEVTRRLLTPKLGDERVAVLYGKRTFREGVLNILRADDANWCGQGGCVALAGDAMDAALTRLSATYGNDPSQWRWGQAHHAISEHRPFGAVAALRWLFNLEVPSPGGPHTINVGTYQPNRPQAPFASRKAPSYRAVYDLADPEQSVFIYSTGQSGNVFERRYRDMAEQWAAGQYRPLRMAAGRVTRSLVMAPEVASSSRSD